MKTTIDQFVKRVIYLMLTGLVGMPGLHAQPCGSCTVVQQPCNGDGILITTIDPASGLVPPLTFTYYDPAGSQSSPTGWTDTYTGEYTLFVYVTDGFGHACFLLTGMTRPFNIDPVYPTHAICPNPGSATITINGGVMPDYVEWYDAATFPGASIGMGNPMSLAGGFMYRAKIFYAGCYAFYDSVFIENQSPLSLTLATSDANCTNGTATVTGIGGGTGPYSYLWSNGATSSSVTGLSSGSYWVRVTDGATGCDRQQNFWINQTVQIPVNIVVDQAPTCLNADGQLVAFGVGGTQPYNYLWSDGQTTQTAVNLAGGHTYNVVLTDANGCRGMGNKTLNSTTPIVVNYSTIPSSCTAPTGSATLTITGGTSPYTVTWSTTPIQSGTTAINLAPGNYHFTVTDNVGCVQSGWVTIPPQNIINASAYAANAVCPATTGTAGVSYSGGVAPHSFLWNTGEITQIISPAAVGWHYCTITDADGCSVNVCTQVLMTSPVIVGINSTPATCMYTADGSLLAIPTGGTPPYTYLWLNGSTSNPVTNLAPGNYSVRVTDNNGCSKFKYCVVGNSATTNDCYCTVEGTVWYDQDASCSFTPGETGIEHILIHLAPFGYTWTDVNGHYSFTVPTGSYTLSEVVQYIYPLTPSCPANDPVTFSVTASSGCTYSHDFFNSIDPLHDIHIITTSLGPPIPGNPYHQRLIIQNDGTVYEPDILLNYDPDEEQLSTWSSIPVLSPITGTTWYENSPNSIALNPGNDLQILTHFTVPTNIPLSTVLNFSDIVAFEPPIANWLNDYTPWNNRNNFHPVVIGSWDPNYKEVIPVGKGDAGTITVNDSVLDYIIHFQNMGTYYAETVVVTDTLDDDLDWTTIRPGFSTHSYIADLSEDGVLKFTFNNIHLVWASENEINSNGMVTYSIHQKTNLPIGTEIKNTAAIFFDYNAPVITNTTLNTIGNPQGVPEVRSGSDLCIYPNPVSDILYVKVKEYDKIIYIAIYDLTGRLLRKESVTEDALLKIPVTELTAGVYIIDVVKINGEKVSCKFVRN